MNRFFSKLNLSDIKIKAEGNSFPPDADEAEEPEPQEYPAAPVIEEEPEAVFMPAPTELPDFSEQVEPGENGHGTWIENSTVEYTAAADDISGNGVDHETEIFGAPQHNGFEPTGATEIVSEGLVVNVGDVLKVSSRSRPSAVAGAIAGVVREVGKAEVQAIGAGATNQAIKAVAIARDYLLESGIEAVCVPAFIDVAIENENRTAIRLVIEPR